MTVPHPTRWQAAILEAVRAQGFARIRALAEKLGVSDETVRRHVRALVEAGMLTRAHGGVAWAGPAPIPLVAPLAAPLAEAPFERRLRVHAAEKRALAAAVAARVEDGQVLLIDTGSTTAYVAQALGIRRNLTVITNSLEIARHLVGRAGNRVYMAGGELRADLAATVGPEALAFIRQFRADLAILSVAAVDAGGTFMDFDLDEARIARAMIEASSRALVVADSSKFGRRAAVGICATSDIDLLVTDRAPPSADAGWITEAGIELIVAPL
ncbi:DeoR family glycerol-3-phosphate regulon repressor [Angulomicrobium tetraedrale]|uniref:DeoR family glycerol-3-phosphate regulon repressor n=1 Tax=Ancylobacter tetraedralis TaxID=217068 RepID=A0A839Z6C8_9HYPH|nr:DeoR/GlpR family DNA-binding transcription regulator [Ancylobacter tetraedralis]MBB3769906.1 DeoR family glycerol-3-phosphate regulon repressor [Ancylobacter tetraedralis]